MNQRIVVAGTDTGIGKTVFAAGLADLLGADYWKPIQAGLEGETDSAVVARLGGLSDDRVVPERYRLQTPASPHHAAAIDGVRIAVESLEVPDTGGRPLVIEGSGGLLVPLDRTTLYIDVFARWRLPVVRCAIATSNFSASPLSAIAIRKANAPFARPETLAGLDDCRGFLR